MSELQDWFNEVWFIYPSDLSHNKKGAKPPALKAAQKIYKSGGIQELNRIKGNIQALIRYDRKELSSGGRPDRWPHFSTFLNQGYYDREIGSYTEIKNVERICNCGEKAQVGYLCLKCLNKDAGWKKMHYENLKSMGLGKYKNESMGDYALRCREYLRKHYPVIYKSIGA